MKASKKNEGEGERRRSTHKTTKAHRRNGPSLLIGLFLAPLQALRHWRKREKRRSRRAETVHTQKHKDAAERERESARERERERKRQRERERARERTEEGEKARAKERERERAEKERERANRERGATYNTLKSTYEEKGGVYKSTRRTKEKETGDGPQPEEQRRPGGLVPGIVSLGQGGLQIGFLVRLQAFRYWRAQNL